MQISARFGTTQKNAFGDDVPTLYGVSGGIRRPARRRRKRARDGNDRTARQLVFIRLNFRERRQKSRIFRQIITSGNRTKTKNIFSFRLLMRSTF
jgi:hypothetical protein